MMRHLTPGPVLLLGITVGVTACPPPRAAAADRPAVIAVGGKVPVGSALRDVRGNRHALSDFKESKAIVLAFLGADCPLSALYIPGLVRMEKQYHGRSVQFLAVYPNAHDDLDQVAASARDHDIPFPVLKDNGQHLADTLGVKRVPAAVVLDGQLMLRYRGRIDDRYGAGFRRQKAKHEELAAAVDAVLAGKAVAVTETEADGCLIDRATKVSRGGVTFTKQVARVLQERCQACHRPGQAAPFSLLSYDDAVRHARMIKEVTTQRRMPPWHADARYGTFTNNRRLTPGEIDTLAAWVDAGTPRGDDKDLPAPAAWTADWQLGKPDLVVRMPKEYEVPADGVVPYQRVMAEVDFPEDRWVQKAEARPGVAAVVHHVVAYLLPPGTTRPFSAEGSMTILVGWAPGDLGLVCPPDTGLRIAKGSKLLFELHYTPNGKAVRDRSAVGITFAKKPPKHELQMDPFVNETIRIPAQAQDYRAEATMRFREDARLVSLVPHMHWRGKDYRYEIIYPDGHRQTILSVPRWDFNWQSVYRFREPVKVPKGSRLHAVAHWDNSRNNPYNPDPAKEVRFGLQTWEEMMVGWVSFVWERPGAAERLAHEPFSEADRMFDRLDRNGDDVITKDEFPQQVAPLLKSAGIQLPERMTRPEFRQLYQSMRKVFGRNRRRAERPASADKDHPARSVPPGSGN